MVLRFQNITGNIVKLIQDRFNYVLQVKLFIFVYKKNPTSGVGSSKQILYLMPIALLKMVRVVLSNCDNFHAPFPPDSVW